MKLATQRGALIVFEGCDRSGKTTLCQRLVKLLSDSLPLAQDDKPSVKMMRFPDRETLVGQLIDSYLKGKSQLHDKAIHLLFSTNRWEKADDLKAALDAGQNVIIDRYAFSGVAFSAAKDGLTLDWCRQPDRGLPKPDLVCFLDVSPEEAAKRGGFGKERYETTEFQAKVRENYNALMEDNWTIINTDGKTLDQVFLEIKDSVSAVIEKTNKGAVEELWPLED